MIGLYVVLPQFLVTRLAPQIPASQIGFVPLPLLVIPTPLPTPLPTPSPTPGLVPVTIIIPKLEIKTAVELVGLTPTNNMDVPKDAANVGWYEHGPRPGEQGNAVMTGHYDTVTGRPAIFYYLKKLAPGDEVEVISNNAVKNIFVVTEVATIPYDKFPSDFVFKSKPGRNLNLITCDGIWDRQKRIYSDRIVVYTTLKEASGGSL